MADMREADVLPDNAETKSVTVLVVGQTPPPINGQTLMIQSFLDGHYDRMRLVYVPMRFSRSSNELGRFSFRKLALIVSTLLHIIVTRFRNGADILYYPPADPKLAPVLRDLMLLIPTRWLFRKTVFHFHAAGLCEIYDRLPRVLRPLFQLAYREPDLAIFTTAATSAEGTLLRARRTAIIPCGIPDLAASIATCNIPSPAPATILFAGILCEGKGVLNLIHACGLLKRDGVSFRTVCLGQFSSAEFRQEVEALLQQFGLSNQVTFPGVLTGAEKDRWFADATVFCFPSHYPAESFGVVLIEAMSFSLPIVATDWRGIPEVLGRVPESELQAGYLVPVRDSAALAEALKQLLASPADRQRMGSYNRSRYLELYTVDIYRRNLETQLVSLI